MTEPATVPLPCPICGAHLRLSVTTNKNGKHAITVHCPEDGRHFRGFINHRPFVEAALDRLLAAEAAGATLDAAQPDRAGAAPPGLHKPPERPVPSLGG